MTSSNNNTATARGRIGWIDFAKVIAIFFVVLIHTHCQADLTFALKGFVMPAFFFFSGYLFSVERNPGYGKFAYKRFRQLVVPYLWINIVAYLMWFFVLRHYGNDASSALAWHEPLVAVALGIPPGLVHDIPLWSLLCFFLVEMIYYPIRRYAPSTPDRAIAAVAFAVAGVVSLTAPDEGWALPFSLAPTACGVSFFALGHWARSRNEIFSRATRPDVLLLLLSIALMQIGLYLNTPTQFFVGKVGNPLYYALTACGGILFTVQLAAFFDRLMGDGRFIRFLSRGTLLICGFHLMAFSVIKGVMYMGFGIEPSLLTAGVLRGLAMSVAAVLLCLPVIRVVERWFRFLVNK